METPHIPWYRQITVEPTMFLYMLAFQVTSVVEQAFFVHKACRVDHDLPAEICDNLSSNKTLQKQVQITVSTFHQWNSIAGHVAPIVIALFLGAWSDRRGRKLPLLLGLVGKLIYSLGILLNIQNDSWNLNTVIYTATVPGALTGADVAIFASAFAYISDVSSIENRTLRITILDICYMITFPIGIALGSYLFNSVVNRSFLIMFILNASIIFAAILYSVLNLNWRTSERQRPITELKCCGIFPDFFDLQHVRDSLQTLTRPRSSHRRMLLWLFMVSMACYTFQRDERPQTYLYTNYKFNWTTKEFSDFKTMQSTTQNVMLLFGVPVMTRLFNWRETAVAMYGAANFAIARFFFALAEVPWVFYIGGVISSAGPMIGPMIRSMASKIVNSSERGKVFALLSVCDNAVPFISGVLYTQVYNATIGVFPGIFYLTMCMESIVFVIMLFIHLKLGVRPLSADESPNLTQDDQTENQS